ERLAQLSAGHVPTTDPIAIAGRDEGAAVRGKSGTMNFVIMTTQDGNLPSRRGVPKAHRPVRADLGIGHGAAGGEQLSVWGEGKSGREDFDRELVEGFARGRVQ